MLRIRARMIDVFDRCCRYFAVPWVQRLPAEVAQPGQRVDVITDTAGFGDIRESGSGKHAIGREEQSMRSFDDRNTPRGMAD